MRGQEWMEKGIERGGDNNNGKERGETSTVTMLSTHALKRQQKAMDLSTYRLDKYVFI